MLGQYDICKECNARGTFNGSLCDDCEHERGVE